MQAKESLLPWQLPSLFWKRELHKTVNGAGKQEDVPDHSLSSSNLNCEIILHRMMDTMQKRRYNSKVLFH